MIPVGAYLKSPDPAARAAGLSELRPAIFRRKIHEYATGVTWLYCSLHNKPVAPSEWIEYVPKPEPIEKTIQGRKFIPICARCNGSRTIDRGPPAGDGPCPDCFRFF